MTSVVGSKARPRRLEKLALKSYRNLKVLHLEPGPHFNVIHGDNGAGKSNLLESIEYLGSLKSFRAAKKKDLIQVGEAEAQIHAKIGGDGPSRLLRIKLHGDSGRRLSLDGKRPRSIAQWKSSVQTVIFHPGHLRLTAGGPDGRRSYMNDILSKMDGSYEIALQEYEKALRSRNRLLKRDEVDPRSVRAFDGILGTRGETIGQARKRFVEELRPWVMDVFHELVGEGLRMTLTYAPRVEPDAENIQACLERAYAKDRARGFTADGPHADDLEFRLRDVNARHHASQGQHRMAALALKIAELQVLSEVSGAVPILLLDDVSSELDRGRNRILFEILTRLGGQVFLTTTHPEFILLEEGRVDFEVQLGQLGSSLISREESSTSCANDSS